MTEVVVVVVFGFVLKQYLKNLNASIYSSIELFHVVYERTKKVETKKKYDQKYKTDTQISIDKIQNLFSKLQKHLNERKKNNQQRNVISMTCNTKKMWKANHVATQSDSKFYRNIQDVSLSKFEVASPEVLRRSIDEKYLNLGEDFSFQ